MINVESEIKDSIVFNCDSLFVDPNLSQDTCSVRVTGTTVVSVVDLPRENQPNGWVQLLLPIFITLLVVFVEKWVSRYYNNKDEKEGRKQLRNVVLDWIEKVTPIEETFSQSVRKLSKEIKSSDEMQPVPFAMPLTLHDKMKNMSVEKMTDAFLEDFKAERDKRYAHMYNIISSFEFLSKIKNSVRESYDSYNKQSFTLCQQWNNLFERLREKCTTLDNDSPYNTPLTIWFAQQMNNPNSVKSNLQALDSLCVLAFNNNDFEMLSIFTKMRDTARQSLETSKGYAQVFFDVANNIDLSLKSLSESKQYFKKTEL
jgi:hypothetical protein